MALSHRSRIHHSPLRLPVLNEMAKFAGLRDGTRLCVIEAGNGREARLNTGSHLQCRRGLLVAVLMGVGEVQAYIRKNAGILAGELDAETTKLV